MLFFLNLNIVLIHFMPPVSFCNYLKYDKTSGLPMFSRGIEWYQEHKMG